MNARQIGPVEGTTCKLKFRWMFNEPPQYVDLRYGTNPDPSMAGSREWNRAAPITPGLAVWDGLIVVTGDEPVEAEAIVEVPYAPTQLYVGVFPQYWDPMVGGLRAELEDENDELLAWWQFGQILSVPVQAKPDPPSTRTLQSPTLNPPEFDVGTMTLSWNRTTGADFYRLIFMRAGETLPFVRRTTGTRETIYRVRAGEKWQARVEAGLEDLLGEDVWAFERTWSYFTVPASANYAPLRLTEVASIAAVQRGGDSTTIVAGDGGAASLTHSAAQGFHVWHPFGTGALKQGQQIAAISRAPNFIDVFTVLGGRAHVAWWKRGVWQGWAPLPDHPFPEEGAIGACTRNSDFMDVFGVDVSGEVRVSWWNGNPWRPWEPVSGPEFLPGSPIAAACRNDDVNEFWLVDQNGDMRGCHWDGGWHWYSLAGPKFLPGSNVAAVAHPNGMRVAAVDDSGVVQDITWHGGWGHWEARPDVPATPGQPIALGSQDLWMVDNDGALRRWIGSTQVWEVDHVADPPFWKSIAAIQRSVHVMTNDPLNGNRLCIGRVDETNPDGPLAEWWRDE